MGKYMTQAKKWDNSTGTKKPVWEDVTVTVPDKFDTMISQEYASHLEGNTFNYESFIRYLRIKQIKFETS